MREWRVTSFDANTFQLFEDDAERRVFRRAGSAMCFAGEDPAALLRSLPPHPQSATYTQADLKTLLHAFPVVPQVRTFAGPRLASQESEFDWSDPLLPPQGSLHGLSHSLLGRAVEARLNMKVDDREVRVWEWILRERESVGGEYMAGLYASTHGLSLSWLTQTQKEARQDSRRFPGFASVLEVLDYGMLDLVVEKTLGGFKERRDQRKMEAKYPGYTYAAGLVESINGEVARDAIGVSFVLDGRSVISSSISDLGNGMTRLVQVATGNAWGKRVLFAFICDFERYEQTLESLGERVGKFSAVVKSRMIPASSAAGAAPLQARLELAADPNGRFMNDDGAIEVGSEARAIRPIVNWY